MGKRLTFEEINRTTWPGEPEANSCHATAMAIGLTALGYPHGPKEVDRLLGRSPKQLPSLEQMHRLDHKLMDKGFTLEHVLEPGYADIWNYLDGPSADAYAECKQALEGVFGKEFFRVFMTLERFKALHALRARMRPIYDRYMDRGKYSWTVAPITEKLLQDRLSKGNGLAAEAQQGFLGVAHAVALLGPLKDGKVHIVRPADRVSIRSAKRLSEVRKAINLQYGVVFISR